MNSGRPVPEPNPNCFVCICDSSEEYEFYYWLCYGLHFSKAFHYYIVGSVVPFIKIRDVNKLLLTAALLNGNRREEYYKHIETVRLCHEKEKLIMQQLQQVKALKRALLRKFLP